MAKLDRHYSGFIYLLGKPNAGKSTLFNKLIDYPLAIVTHKVQTTRHNLLGIRNKKSTQEIYVDTPGHITPTSLLQEVMMRKVKQALVGSDICCWVVDCSEPVRKDFFPSSWGKSISPNIFILNKIDLISQKELLKKEKEWKEVLPADLPVFTLSAKENKFIEKFQKKVLELLPLHPPYYQKDSLTDKSQDFIIAEVIRKALFLQYNQEVPYSIEVLITQIIEMEEITHIEATIYVERESQKKIVIGKKGIQLKEAGTMARHNLELLLQKKVFLTQQVKVAKGWRKNKLLLNKLGY